MRLLMILILVGCGNNTEQQQSRALAAPVAGEESEIAVKADSAENPALQGTCEIDRKYMRDSHSYYVTETCDTSPGHRTVSTWTESLGLTEDQEAPKKVLEMVSIDNEWYQIKMKLKGFQETDYNLVRHRGLVFPLAKRDLRYETAPWSNEDTSTLIYIITEHDCFDGGSGLITRTRYNPDGSLTEGSNYFAPDIDGEAPNPYTQPCSIYTRINAE